MSVSFSTERDRLNVMNVNNVGTQGESVKCIIQAIVMLKDVWNFQDTDQYTMQIHSTIRLSH